MGTPKTARPSTPATPPRAARIYMRVSTEEQDLARQDQLIDQARAAGYYVAGVYRDKASGARLDRPDLQRMIGDIQPGDVVIAEQLDRISRLPLADAEALIQRIRDAGARLAIPGLVDLSEIAASASGVSRIVLDAVQELLLRIALQAARDDYELRRERQQQGIARAKADGRMKPRGVDRAKHARIIELRKAQVSIRKTAELASASASTVKKVWAAHQQAK